MTYPCKEITLREVREKITTVAAIKEPMTRGERKDLLAQRTTMAYYLYARGVYPKTKGVATRVRDYSDAYTKIIQTLDAADEKFVINLTAARGNQQMWTVEFLEDYYADISRMLARKALEKSGMTSEQIDSVIGGNP